MFLSYDLKTQIALYFDHNKICAKLPSHIEQHFKVLTKYDFNPILDVERNFLPVDLF